MPRVLFELTGFQRDLLYVIAGQDRPSGQQIKKELEGELGDITHGRLYPNLDTLVKNDLIKKGTQDRRTNYYEITDRGIAELERRRTWENQYVDL
ncbi:Transcriptional regulator, PadR family [Halalkaliarchaeum sp. AArc-CO]|uniref:PadR family transcriptional regulator n=1 Tax=Halalkaliarchaeum sp. AArc-CO TaxID=2866381 RepID=UPI00217E4F43|nr:PadR family transcriptional regulator [Halalkaliarchaeum sp. AArc-CO]UWG50184.1 Transcriptional regulator, PadR family [Halalkaliarchaeum sp. AArc-CO]